MEKIIFDSFEPNSACYEPAIPKKEDACIVTATFHVSDSEKNEIVDRSYRLSFQRNNDHFKLIDNGSDSSLAVFYRLYPAEARKQLIDDEFQHMFRTTVAYHKWIDSQFETFTQKTSYTGEDLKALSKKFIHFIMAGNIQNPDPSQTKQNMELLGEIFNLSLDSLLWFKDMSAAFLDDSNKAILTPEAVSRLTWFSNQVGQLNEFKEAFFSQSPPENMVIMSAGQLIIENILNYALVGSGHLTTIQNDLKELIGACPPDWIYQNPDYPYKFFQEMLSNILLTDHYYTQNLPARARLNEMLDFFNTATQEHWSLLQILKEPTSSRFHLQSKLEHAATLALSDPKSLGHSVRFEMAMAYLSNDWFQDPKQPHGKVIQAISENILIDRTDPLHPMIRLDLNKVRAARTKILGEHGIQERECNIAFLASLRYLFGENYSNTHLAVWTDQNKTENIPVDTSLAQELKIFSQEISTEIESSLQNTGPQLFLGELGLTALGAGLSVWANLDKNTDPYYLKWTGYSLLGTGASASLCHLLLNTRNQYISDSICGGIGLSLGLSAAVFQEWMQNKTGGKNPIMAMPGNNNNVGNNNNIGNNNHSSNNSNNKPPNNQANNSNNTNNLPPRPLDAHNPVTGWGP